MKYLICVLLFSFSIYAGVGDIAGGNNRHFKRFIDHPNFHVDWPVIKYAKNKHFPIYDLCILNSDKFGTKTKYNGKRLKMDRIYSPLNCQIKNDPKCDNVLRYVDDFPQINVYFIPFEFNLKKIDVEDFIRDQFIVRVLLYQIPQCEK